MEQSLKGRACTPQNEHSVSRDIEAACPWGLHMNLVSTDRARTPTATEDAAPAVLSAKSLIFCALLILISSFQEEETH